MSNTSTLNGTGGDSLASFVPGLILVAVITTSAYGLRHLPFLSALSPMISAIFVGMVFANTVGCSPAANTGIAIAGKRLLRLAVALLGLQLTFTQLADVGIRGVLCAATALTATFLFTVGLGRVLRVDRKLGVLLAAGTSVCGASAIAGANAAVGANDEDVSYAVACVTVFGTVAMFLYPFLQAILDLAPQTYGMWVGLSVHEVAQVVGAAFQDDQLSGEIAVVTKLARVMMLAPLVIGLAVFVSRSRPDRAHANTHGPLVPFFILGFLALVLLNSSRVLTDQLRAPIVSATPVLLTAAMGALGLGTNFTKLKKHGFRPLLLSAAASLFIALVALMLVKLMA